MSLEDAMQHPLHDRRVLYLSNKREDIDRQKKKFIPRKVRIGVQAGTFQSFTVPDQLPVANTSLFGANRTCEIGRSSPICEPRLTNSLSKMLEIQVQK